MEIYRAKNHLKAERRKLIDKGMAKPLVLALVTAVLGLCPKLTEWIVVILAEGFGVNVYLARLVQACVIILPALFALKVDIPLDPQIGVLDGGIEGEQIALSLVCQAGLNAAVYTNLQIPTNRGGHKECDLIVVHPSGITIVECKHMSGLISGSFEQHLLRHTNRYKDEYIKNPAMQSRDQVHCLKEYLKDRGLDVPLRRAVMFTHDAVELELTDQHQYCPVFTAEDAEEFAAYLKGTQQVIPNRTLERVNRALQHLL